MENKEPNIDDFFRHTEAFSKKIHEYMAGKKFDERFATAMLNASDPDSIFKADIAMKLSTVLNMVEMLVEYINRPIKKEGILQRKLDGSVMLDDTPVPVGALVEYWANEKWSLGKLTQNPQTKHPYIIDVVSSKTMIDKIEQLKARMR